MEGFVFFFEKRPVVINFQLFNGEALPKAAKLIFGPF